MECDVQRKLEGYLDDIYKEECEFQIKEDEITFIQTGIETLVEQIVNKVHKNISVKKLRGVEICEPDIIKVGSFYEGTRNKYPDEFDFIYVFCEQLEELNKTEDLIYALDLEFERSFEPVCMFYQIKGTLQYQLAGAEEILFGGYVKKHGPAHLLKFLYHKESGETRCINVDLVPAATVKCSSFLFSDFIKFSKDLIKAHCGEGPLKERHLFVGKRVSFTDSEIHFMKNKLSKNHVKVYRILKYLINGHGDNEKLAEILTKYKIPAIVYSFYMIKIAVIQHHNECKNSGRSTVNIESYAVDVLFRISEVPSTKNVASCLKEMINYVAMRIGRIPVIKCGYIASISDTCIENKGSLSQGMYSSKESEIARSSVEN